MKKILLLAVTLVMYTCVNAQVFKSKGKKANPDIPSELVLSADFGFVHFFSDGSYLEDVLRERVNSVATIQLGVPISPNINISSGITFSILPNGAFHSWENTLSYYSVNTSVIYTTPREERNLEFYFGAGGSYVLTTTDLDQDHEVRKFNIFSANAIIGATYWFGESDFGVSAEHIFKAPLGSDLVMHNMLTLGLKYKFKH